MSRVWFSQPLETVATYWRVIRRDGVTLGFTTHDRDLWFDGVVHRSAPGMVPSAIRRSAGFDPDSAEVQGALSHDSIAAEDLAEGRFDGARVLIGLIDWEDLDRHTAYRGTIGMVREEAGSFTAVLESRKAELQRDPVPRTSPSCRAAFCGPGCTLSAAQFSHTGVVVSSIAETGSVTLGSAAPAGDLTGGSLRWFDGPYAGLAMEITAHSGLDLTLDRALDRPVPPGAGVLLREGCDRTLATCAGRFGNAVNFQGEPHLPGNDMVTRYPSPAG